MQYCMNVQVPSSAAQRTLAEGLLGHSGRPRCPRRQLGSALRPRAVQRRRCASWLAQLSQRCVEPLGRLALLRFHRLLVVVGHVQVFVAGQVHDHPIRDSGLIKERREHATQPVETPDVEPGTLVNPGKVLVDGTYLDRCSGGRGKHVAGRRGRIVVNTLPVRFGVQPFGDLLLPPQVQDLEHQPADRDPPLVLRLESFSFESSYAPAKIVHAAPGDNHRTGGCVDVVACLLGVHSRSATYQLLARLRYGGLAQVQPVELGHVLGGRRIGLWSITQLGRQHLQRYDGMTQRPEVPIYGLPSRHRSNSRAIDFPLLVSSYRLLARLVAEQAASGPVEVLAWEFRWRRRAEDRLGGRSVRVELPAAASLAPRSAKPGWTVLLLPDLGTAPVAHYRGLVRRLLLLRAAASDSRLTEPLLVIGKPDPDGRGGRAARWASMLAHVAQREEQAPSRFRVITWDRGCAVGWHEQPVGLQPTSMQQVLDLVGRDPCLSRRQLAGLLGTRLRRVARMCGELVARGWVRPIPPTDIPLIAQAQLKETLSALGLTELTPLGRRVLASGMGLNTATAAKHHGLSGGQNWAGRRRRLLRTLPHTLGVNDVFVALAAAARRATAGGANEALEECRSAAPCERRRCKPDGFGRYRRRDITVGFFLEYDRGTERAAAYAAKFDAYYRYRNSGESARDYTDFPVVLFVTTSELAEYRISEAARRAWLRQGGRPLPVLITRAAVIQRHSDGLLAPAWRTPTDPGRRSLWSTDIE
jgi:hypothetical protein